MEDKEECRSDEVSKAPTISQRIACCRKSNDIETGENIAKLPRVYILLGG